MSSVLEALCRRHARRISTNGVSMLTHDGDPLLVAAFKELGWADAVPETPVKEAATVRDAERAVLPKPKGYTR